MIIKLFLWMFWEKKVLKRHKSLWDPIYNWVNWFCPVFTDLNILFVVPFLVEPMFPEWTQIRVHLVIFMAIRILENMQAWFIFFCFKARWVSRSKNVDLVFFFIFFLILFYFQFIFQFSIFRTLGLGLEVIGHNIDHGTWKKEVEGSGTKWCYTT